MNEKRAKKFRRLAKLLSIQSGNDFKSIYRALKKEYKRNELAGLKFPSRKSVECS